MFNKLESEYKLKLEEQQRLNDLKLEEIKKSLLENQEQLILKQCNAAAVVSVNTSDNRSNNTASTLVSSSLNKSQDLLKSTFTIEKSNQQPTSQISPTSSSASSSSSSSSSSSGVATDPMTREKKSVIAVNESQASSINQTNSIVENAKYISNLRLELKTKHARHVQDLKDYYEKELDELRRKLSKAEQSIANSSNGENKNEMIISNFQQQNTDQANLNSELKNTNNSLLSKLVSFFILLY
jgi:hypothetical protein